jgi:hypothetical protein
VTETRGWWACSGIYHVFNSQSHPKPQKDRIDVAANNKRRMESTSMNQHFFKEERKKNP